MYIKEFSCAGYGLASELEGLSLSHTHTLHFPIKSGIVLIKSNRYALRQNRIPGCGPPHA